MKGQFPPPPKDSQFSIPIRTPVRVSVGREAAGKFSQLWQYGPLIKTQHARESCLSTIVVRVTQLGRYYLPNVFGICDLKKITFIAVSRSNVMETHVWSWCFFWPGAIFLTRGQKLAPGQIWWRPRVKKWPRVNGPGSKCTQYFHLKRPMYCDFLKIICKNLIQNAFFISSRSPC